MQTFVVPIEFVIEADDVPVTIALEEKLAEELGVPTSLETAVNVSTLILHEVRVEADSIEDARVKARQWAHRLAAEYSSPFQAITYFLVEEPGD